MPRPNALATLLVLIVLAACTTNPAVPPTSPPTTTTIGTTSSTRPITTTTRATPTTALAAGLSPINGMPVGNDELLERRVLAVKIDNAPGARPQSGLQEADGIIELLVESGVTRFIALFHGADSEYLGPVRSGRPTDPTLLNPLGATFAISGGQPWVLAQISEAEVPFIGEVRPATFRIRSRRAPHNLYADTTLLRDIADARQYPDDPPPPLFSFGELPGRAEQATEVTVSFSDGTVVTWSYDGARYLRTLNGKASTWVNEDGAAGPVAVDTLVVLFGRKFTAFPPNGTGTPVPAMDLVGKGRALVFAGGRLVEGEWRRGSAASWFTLTSEEGDPLPVPPGVPWISLVPTGRPVDW